MESNLEDLVSVISIYATTQVTLDIVTSFAPSLAYLPHTWKQKTLMEARGLVLNSIDADGSWWEYYLLKNGTLFGDALKLEITSNDDTYHTTTNILRSDIIFHTVANLNFNRVEIYQRRDLTVVLEFEKNLGSVSGYGYVRSMVRTMHMHVGIPAPVPIEIQFDRKIRSIIEDQICGLIVLTEYGDIWRFDGEGLRRSYSRYKGIVQLKHDPIFSRWFMLNRNGLVLFTENGSTRLINLPKVVEVNATTPTDADYNGILTMSNGKRAYLYINMNVNRSAISYIPHKTPLYQDRTSRATHDEQAIASISPAAGITIYTTKDRTLYLRLPQLDPIAVDGTTHRTQKLELNTASDYRVYRVFAVVDPHQR